GCLGFRFRSLRELRRDKPRYGLGTPMRREARSGSSQTIFVKELSWGFQGSQRSSDASMRSLQAKTTEYSANGSFTELHDAGSEDPALRGTAFRQLRTVMPTDKSGRHVVLPFGSPHCTQSFSRAFEKNIYGQASRLIS